MENSKNLKFNRVNKPTARKMFRENHVIWLLPCKVSDSAVNGSHPFVKPVTISKLTCGEQINQFDRAVNNYEYYNCNAELGYYAHYFVIEEEYENYLLSRLNINKTN